MNDKMLKRGRPRVRGGRSVDLQIYEKRHAILSAWRDGMDDSTPVPMEIEQQELVQIQEAESTTTSSTDLQPEAAPSEITTATEIPQETAEQPQETVEEQPQEPVEEPAQEETVEEQPPPEPEVPPTPPKPKITIIIKTLKEKQTIEVEEDASVKDIKTIAAEKFAADPDYLCLIFAGKMMEDDDTLETHNIQDGMSIHLIIKTAPRQFEPGSQRPPADISQTPYGFGTIGGLVGLESLGLGSANFMELQNRMQTELLGNPELLRRVLENPLVQSLMNDTDNMKALIQNNPQMKDLMSRHPEIKSMLNNTELLQQTAELARNPAMLQELMRNIDGSNPMDESATTFATLPNIYNNLQEPNLSAAAKAVQEAQKRAEQGCVFNNPQMSSLLQQMYEKPQLIQNMLSAPYTQVMLQALSADPTMASAIVNENPLYKNNEALQQYITSMMPQMIQQLQNPEVLNMVANPQAINALLQIQEGLDNLKNVAPGLVSNLGMGSFGESAAAATSSSAASPATTGEASSSSSQTPQSASFSKFMAQMVTNMSYSDMRQPPEHRYKQQMALLKSMGFANEDINLETLTACFGDVNAAVQKLLAQNAKMV